MDEMCICGQASESNRPIVLVSKDMHKHVHYVILCVCVCDYLSVFAEGSGLVAVTIHLEGLRLPRLTFPSAKRHYQVPPCGFT